MDHARKHGRRRCRRVCLPLRGAGPIMRRESEEHEMAVAGAVTDRAGREVEHGEWLAQGDPEAIWGWGTPAGRLRALRRAQVIAEGGRLRPGAHVLEVGCGTGLFTGLFAETGATIVAVDISGALLDRARSRGLPTDRVRFLERRFEDCDVEGPFDAVIGSSVLHHLDLDASLARIRELLRPGGRLSFAEPNLLNPQVWLERNARPWFPYVSPDETAFVGRGLRLDLRRSGYEEVEVEPFDWLHPRTPPSLIPLASAMTRWLERAPVVREFAGSLAIRGRRPTSSPTR